MSTIGCLSFLIVMAWIDDRIFVYKGNDLLVMLFLIAHADDNGFCEVGLRTIANDCGISYQSVREAVKRLQGSGQIKTETTQFTTHNTTHYPTRFEVCVYEGYKKKPQRSLQRTLQRTINEKKDITERAKDFYNELVPFVISGQYPKEMVRAFYDYWSEPNQTKTKMRFEMMQTWSTSGRLSTWARKDKTFKNNGYGRETITDKIKQSAADADEFSRKLKAQREANLGSGDSPEVW